MSQVINVELLNDSETIDVLDFIGNLPSIHVKSNS